MEYIRRGQDVQIKVDAYPDLFVVKYIILQVPLTQKWHYCLLTTLREIL
ncbi:hypothetical protein ABIB30_000603 [Pedobacter sp. UYP1]